MLGLFGVLPKGLLNGELKFAEENDAKDGTFRSPASFPFACDFVESRPEKNGRGFEVVRGVEGRSSGVDDPFDGGKVNDVDELAKLGSFPSAHSTAEKTAQSESVCFFVSSTAAWALTMEL
jgi:hypothetical protein